MLFGLSIATALGADPTCPSNVPSAGAKRTTPKSMNMADGERRKKMSPWPNATANGLYETGLWSHTFVCNTILGTGGNILDFREGRGGFSMGLFEGLGPSNHASAAPSGSQTCVTRVSNLRAPIDSHPVGGYPLTTNTQPNYLSRRLV
jgi:hypothetical protein